MKRARASSRGLRKQRFHLEELPQGLVFFPPQAGFPPNRLHPSAWVPGSGDWAMAVRRAGHLADSTGLPQGPGQVQNGPWFADFGFWSVRPGLLFLPRRKSNRAAGQDFIRDEGAKPAGFQLGQDFLSPIVVAFDLEQLVPQQKSRDFGRPARPEPRDFSQNLQSFLDVMGFGFARRAFKTCYQVGPSPGGDGPSTLARQSSAA